ncbi:reverse transcriptase-like protein [Halospeciosus flavus]|uniref:reverse transcriptase-like protein n=1 Tax=Halospeciosus flavus TaxID=3032283 RepID=UPI0036089DD5
MPVIECDVEEARERLDAAGADVEEGHTEHERWRAELGDANAVAYDDKVVVQGPSPSTSRRSSKTAVGESTSTSTARVGESGSRRRGIRARLRRRHRRRRGETIGRATNNQAEYEALIRGLETATKYGFDEIVVKGDSQLIVKQVKGAWNTNDPELKEKRIRVRELLDEFDEWSLTHVPREVNERADELANEALDEA